MFRNDLFRDRTIVVTGGGTGLGRAMALRLAELGANLVLTSRSLEHLEPTVRELEARGARALAVAGDVRKLDDMEKVAEAAISRFGSLYGLVNNAAGNFLCPTEELSSNAFASVLGIVLQGTFHASQACAKQMMKKGEGSILSILTTYVEFGSAYVAPSAAAKAGVLAFTRSIAAEWARHGIRANALSPGLFPTEGAFSRLMPPGLDLEKGRVEKIPARRYGKHEELANLAAFLLAPESSYITGVNVPIDGGESLMGGTFNELTTLDANAVAQVMRAMKPAKK